MILLPFTMGRAAVAAAFSPESVRAGIEAIFDALPPPDPAEGIPLIQPRAQGGFPSLGSADTDLRVVAAVLGALRDRGHRRLRLGDGLVNPTRGPAPSTFRRSRIDRLAHHYGAELVDLSRGPQESLTLPCGVVEVSSYALKGPYIPLPTVGVDRELGLAGALAGLLGVVHPTLRPKLLGDARRSLPALAKALSPALVIGDCLTLLEGENPPEDLRPFRFERIIAATEPCLFDLIVGRILGLTPEEMPAVAYAIEEGQIPTSTFSQVEHRLSVVRDLRRPLRPFRDKAALPKPRRRRGRALKDRALRLLPWGQPLRQLPAPEGTPEAAGEDTLGDLHRDAARCGTCHRCEEFCPVGLSRAEIGVLPPVSACVSCLYCYLSCPKGALNIAGDPGPLLPALVARKTALEHL